MKNTLKSLFFGLLIFGMLSGCGKDNNESPDTSKNIMKHNNVEYPTPNGMLVFKELISPSLCKYDLIFYSSNFTFNSTNGELIGINGTGQIITFHIISPIQLIDVNADLIINRNDIVLNNLVLDGGSYVFSSEYTSKTFETDFITSAQNTSDYIVHSLESGELNISKSGDIYEIVYTGLDENEKAISGFFSGKLNVIRNL